MFAQTVTNNKKLPRVFIGEGNESTLYLDKFNMLFITTKPKANDSLVIETSQGQIYHSTFGKDSYYLRIDTLGKLLVQVYILLNNKRIFLGQRIFKVVLSDEQKTLNSLKTKPNISLGKYDRGRIPIDSIKNLNCLTINKRYILLNSAIYFSGSEGTSCTSIYWLNSNCFDSQFAEVWNRIDVGTIITFDRVEIMDLQTKKKYIIPSIFFNVVKNQKSN